MIVYLAGQANCLDRLPKRHMYEHVLFSHFNHSKRNFRYITRRRRREMNNEGEQAGAAGSAAEGKRRAD